MDLKLFLRQNIYVYHSVFAKNDTLRYQNTASQFSQKTYVWSYTETLNLLAHCKR